MTLFLLSFLTLYGGMHLYVFLRIRGAFNLSRTTGAVFAICMCVTTFAPLLVRVLERTGYEPLAAVAAWLGFVWMGFIFLLLAALLLLDALHLVMLFMRGQYTGAVSAVYKGRVFCTAALVLAFCTTLYGFFEARSIRTEQLTIPTTKLPPGAQKVRIVQVSDVHLGLIIREKRLEAMLEAVRKAEPDIFVSTGDLLDGRLSKQAENGSYARMANMLAGVSASAGAFAVLGNHEYYAGVGHSLNIMKAAGFRVLRNESVVLPFGIALSGADDGAWERVGLTPPQRLEHEVLKGLPATLFRVNLKHRPVVEPADDGLFDLQLSGHTHKGQLLPFYPFTWLEFSIHSGITRTPRGSLVQVSRGTGTWGPPIRFLAPPEVTVIDIVPAAGIPPQNR